MSTRTTKRSRATSLPQPVFTADDLLADLEATLLARPEGDEGMTIEEICRAKRWSSDRVRKALHEEFVQGRLVVGRTRRLNIAGIPHYTPVYRLKG
jgi:hypothetical protein